MPGFFAVPNVCQNDPDGLFNPWSVALYGALASRLWIGLVYGLWIELAIVVIGALVYWRPLPRGGALTMGAVAVGAFFTSWLYTWTTQRTFDDCTASFPPNYDAQPLFEAVASKWNTALDMTIAAFLIGTALTTWLVVAGWRLSRTTRAGLA